MELEMRRTPLRPLLAIAALSLVWITPAQFDGGGQADTKPWQSLLKGSKKQVKLNFTNSSIEMIVRFFSNASGITIVKDPTLTGATSLVTPKNIPIADAFTILAANLDLKGFTIQQQDNFLIIKAKPKPTARAGGPGGPGGPGAFGALPGFGAQGGPGPSRSPSARVERRARRD